MEEQKSSDRNQSQKLNTGRIKWVDIIKGICILFVMLSHSYPPDAYARFYTPFFLTMFFFTAGMTYRHRDWRAFIKSKAIRLILPLFGFGLLRIGYYVIINHENPLLLLGGLFLQISVNYDELWFLSCMFTTYVVFYWLYAAAKKLSEKYYLRVLLSISVILNVLGYVDILYLQWKFPWEMELASVMIFYMALGHVFKQNMEKTEILQRKAAPIATLLFLASVVFIPNEIQIHREIFDNPVLFSVESILAILPFVAIAKWLEKRRVSVMLIYLGRNTLYYFALSGIIREVYNYFRPYEIYTNRYAESIISMILMSAFLVIPITLLHKGEQLVISWWQGRKNVGDKPL